MAVVCSSVIEYEQQPVDAFDADSPQRYGPPRVLVISFANSRSLSRALFQRRNLHLGGSGAYMVIA